MKKISPIDSLLRRAAHSQFILKLTTISPLWLAVACYALLGLTCHVIIQHGEKGFDVGNLAHRNIQRSLFTLLL